jgi:hypothetical protein
METIDTATKRTGARSHRPVPDQTEYILACRLRTIHAFAQMRFNEYTTLAIPNTDASYCLDRRLVGE